MMRSALAGKTIAFTGELPGMTRKQATQIAQAAGATVSTAVTANTDFLISGNFATGQKSSKAAQLGVQQIMAPQFFQMTNNAAPAAPVAAPQQYYAPTQKVAQPWMQTAQQPVMYQQPMATQAPVATPMPRGPRAVAPTPVFTAKPVNLYGMTVAFTGSLETATRADAAQMAQTAGAAVASQVSSATNFLVCGATPGANKVMAAQENGVRCISEKQFMQAAADAVLAVPEPVAQQPVMYQQPVAQQPRAPRTPAAAPAINLMGMNVVFTGALNMNRLSAAVMATKAGAKVSSAITANTNYVVCGPGAGAKMAQAQSMGLPIISEAQFVAACRQ